MPFSKTSKWIFGILIGLYSLWMLIGSIATAGTFIQGIHMSVGATILLIFFAVPLLVIFISPVFIPWLFYSLGLEKQSWWAFLKWIVGGCALSYAVSFLIAFLTILVLP